MKALLTTIFLVMSLAIFAQDPPVSPAPPTPPAAPAPADTIKKPVVTGTVSANDGQSKTEVYKVSTDTTAADTTKIELKNAYITIVSKADNDNDDDDDGWDRDKKYQLTYWNGIDLGVNGILGADHDFQLGDASFLEPKYGKSRYISFNFAQAKIKIINNYVGLTTGMSFQIYNYKYGGSTEFTFTEDSLLASPSGEKNISKNKIRASYFAIPLMLEFNTSLDPKKSFHISAGVIGKVKIENMYKQKYSLDGEDRKASVKGDMGFNTWQVDAVARVGYRRLTLFAQVGLMPLFDNDNTPDVYTFATGFFIKV